MAIASVMMFLPALLLVAFGVMTIVWGVRTYSAPARRSRAVGVLRVIAGLGMLAAALLSLGAFYTEVQYGVLLFPVLGAICAAVWAAVLLGTAAIVHWQRSKN